MFRLVESIKLVDGVFYNLPYHQARMDSSVRDLAGRLNSIQLQNHLSNTEHPITGVFKCRIVYDVIIHHVEFIAYAVKTINNLKVISADDIDYTFKFENRSDLDRLYQQRESCDDIVIVKNGLVTDSYNANLIFFNGSEWVTPETPLLKGTMREFLLKTDKIRVAPIHSENLNDFKSCKLINALRDFDCPELPISNIVF